MLHLSGRVRGARRLGLGPRALRAHVPRGVPRPVAADAGQGAAVPVLPVADASTMPYAVYLARPTDPGGSPPGCSHWRGCGLRQRFFAKRVPSRLPLHAFGGRREERVARYAHSGHGCHARTPGSPHPNLDRPLRVTWAPCRCGRCRPWHEERKEGAAEGPESSSATYLLATCRWEQPARGWRSRLSTRWA